MFCFIPVASDDVDRVLEGEKDVGAGEGVVLRVKRSVVWSGVLGSSGVRVEEGCGSWEVCENSVEATVKRNKINDYFSNLMIWHNKMNQNPTNTENFNWL